MKEKMESFKDRVGVLERWKWNSKCKSPEAGLSLVEDKGSLCDGMRAGVGEVMRNPGQLGMGK